MPPKVCNDVSSEAQARLKPDDLEALENDPDFEALRATRMAKFNLFDVLGEVDRELRHSNALSFLLKPYETHRLGDSVLRALLAHVAPDDVANLHFNGADVLREYPTGKGNLDVLVLVPGSRFLVAIENKIRAPLGSDQLNRYRTALHLAWPRWKQYLILLTVDGRAPPEPDAPDWLPCSYSVIADALDKTLKTPGLGGEPEVHVILEHYLTMLRRHVVRDDALIKKAHALYNRHRAVIDFIYQIRPDERAVIAKMLEEMVGELDARAKLDACNKSYVRFFPTAWTQFDKKIRVTPEGGWTPSRRCLLFEFKNLANAVHLDLVVGPTQPASVRDNLYDFCLESDILKPNPKGENFSVLFRQTFARFRDGDLADDERRSIIHQKIQAGWEDFQKNHFDAVIKDIARHFRAPQRQRN